jgi:hypothetical protein
MIIQLGDGHLFNGPADLRIPNLEGEQKALGYDNEIPRRAQRGVLSLRSKEFIHSDGLDGD